MAKKGEVNTCPNCGATLEGGNAKCPECGYTLSNVSANSSAILLDKRLQRCSRWDRSNIIRSFPIPNTRDDLMEFLSVLEPKALVRGKGDEYEKKETNAYYEKYIECLNKARISFGNDSATKMFESKLSHFKLKRYSLIGLIFLASAIVTVILISSLVKIVQNDRLEEQTKQEQKETLQKEYDDWLKPIILEMQAYSDSLSRELDKIPAPTAYNWEKCGQMWNRISWLKKWPVPSKFRNLVSGPHNPNYTYKEIFIKKKNNIGKSITQAHKQALMNGGMDENKADWATVDEFYESNSWFDFDN